MNKLSEIVVATKNAGKVREIQAALLDTGIRLLSLDDYPELAEPVEDGATFMENALLKAGYYMLKTGKPCLADDSGLEVDALNGAPGVYSARYAGENATTAQRNEKLLCELAGIPAEKRAARFCCAMVLMNTNGDYLSAQGACEGRIMTETAGNGGFGYDPLFFCLEANDSMANLDMAQKNAVSHRGRALRALIIKLKEAAMI